MLKALRLAAATTLLLAGMALPVSAQEDFAAFLEGLKAEARSAGISEATIEAALSGVEPVPRVIELDRSQPERTLTFEQYRNRIVSQERIARGRQLYDENRELLEEIGRRYGVQPRFIVALWGIESDYGRVTGDFQVVPALATLAHEGRRAAFFRQELLAALRILDEGHIPVGQMTGSWAGAMGQSQFMPSSFLRFAQDGNGDGRRDIWNSRPDVFASIANYLSQSGWNRNQTWGREVRLPAGFDQRLIGTATRRSVNQWQALGVRRADGGNLPSSTIQGSLVRAGEGGPVFLVYDNYRTFLTWNRSTFFAASVGLLADAIGSQ
ncbi:lytic transglycosylase domain-containing protein [Telmatospirillum sp. J64-1]|uniref:lytic murein transglycosylase n=1 Tax=Telmatospirillum sp. J64-1 TaxID=2502183 RepID=UPI00115DD466|nr:lytic murein transglycosylase [Telmatospirillum sp. J64-1]